MNGDLEDVAALRADGDLAAYLLSLTVSTPEPAQKPDAAPEEPDYVIPHRGAWPIGSAPSGPSPMHSQCTCPKHAPKEAP